MSRIGKGDSRVRESIGVDRSEDFLVRTGPGPDVSWSYGGSGMRERSAISHGFVNSGAASKVEIHGRSSKAVAGAVTRKLTRGGTRRRRGKWVFVFGRLRGQEEQV